MNDGFKCHTKMEAECKVKDTQAGKKIDLNPKGKIVKVLHFLKIEPHWRTWATESDGAIRRGSRVAKKERFHDHKTCRRLTAHY